MILREVTFAAYKVTAHPPEFRFPLRRGLQLAALPVLNKRSVSKGVFCGKSAFTAFMETALYPYNLQTGQWGDKLISSFLFDFDATCAD